MTWVEFAAAAPRIAAIFRRRHAATGDLCMLGTLRSDGWPRLSPMEPRLFENCLWLYGMPHTAKFDDLARDPRFTLHTATVDTLVGDGDAKLWGTVADVQDEALHARLAQDLFEKTGFDIRGPKFEHCYEASIVGAASVEIIDGHLDITTWRAGSAEPCTASTEHGGSGSNSATRCVALGMKLPQELRDLIDAGPLAHLSTTGSDGAPQVSVIWIGRDGDDVLSGHLGRRAKITNIERDPRVALSFDAPREPGVFLTPYAVLHAHASLEHGDAAWELLDRLAKVYLAPDAPFPAPRAPGFLVRYRVDRVTGVGPWSN